MRPEPNGSGRILFLRGIMQGKFADTTHEVMDQMHSVWTEDVCRPHFEPLRRDRHTDVLVIGGGMTGVLCAHMLKRAGVDCLLVEADRICGGVTENTTAKITLQHGLLYDRLIGQMGEARARLYLEAQVSACETYARLCREIACDYEQKDSFVYSTDDPAKLEREVTALNRLGCRAELVETTELPLKTAGAVRVRDQAQFHPLKFALAIASALPIFEHTKVVELMPHKAVTECGEITCERMIVATHFPMLNKHGGYFLKMYQHRSYVLALEGAKDVRGMYVDESDKGLSFRNHGELLLLGGGGHRTGKKGGNWSELSDFARSHFPLAEITGRWATQDCMTLDRIPYIGQYAKRTPDLFVATGFNKWGMSTSMVAATLLTDLVRDKRSDLVEVFSPSRSIWRPQLAVNAFESLVGLLTPTVPRCPHLGCALKYNRHEHSWDCPCHGSRFSERGELINGPAPDDQKGMS